MFFSIFVSLCNHCHYPILEHCHHSMLRAKLCLLPKFMCWSPNASVTVFGDGILGDEVEWSKKCVALIWQKCCNYKKKRYQRSLHSYTEMRPCNDTVRRHCPHKFLLCKPPILKYCVMATRANTRHTHTLYLLANTPYSPSAQSH